MFYVMKTKVESRRDCPYSLAIPSRKTRRFKGMKYALKRRNSITGKMHEYFVSQTNLVNVNGGSLSQKTVERTLVPVLLSSQGRSTFFQSPILITHRSMRLLDALRHLRSYKITRKKAKRLGMSSQRISFLSLLSIHDQ